MSDQAYRTHRAGVGHSKPKGARFPLIEAEVVTSCLANNVHAGAAVYDASVQILSSNDDFHVWVLRVHEWWTCAWFSDVYRRRHGLSVGLECSHGVPKARHEW